VTYHSWRRRREHWPDAWGWWGFCVAMGLLVGSVLGRAA
jgi:hypothetical protein